MTGGMNGGTVFGLFLLFFGLVLTLTLLFLRNRNQHLRHVERMAALEKGAPLPVANPERPWTTRVYLLRGLIWSFSGAALFLCLLGLSAARRPMSAVDRAMEAHYLSKNAGITMEQAGDIVQRDAGRETNGPPASIALLGLLPLSVGLAYLVFYYTGEREKSVPR